MSERRQLLLAGTAAVLMTLLFFFLVLRPAMRDRAEARVELEQARQEEQTLRNELGRLEELRADAPAIQAKLARLTQYLPSSPDLPTFIRVVQQAASRAGVALQSIAPSPPAALEGATGIDVISVTLTVQGGFHRIEDFLARLENAPRAVEVTALSLSPQQDELSRRTLLQSTLTLRMYVAQPDAQVSAGVRSPTTPSPPPGQEQS